MQTGDPVSKIRLILLEPRIGDTIGVEFNNLNGILEVLQVGALLICFIFRQDKEEEKERLLRRNRNLLTRPRCRRGGYS